MTTRFHRRKFFGKTAALAAGARLIAAPNILASPSPNSKLNIAGIGEKGKLTGEPRLLSEERMKDFRAPAPSIPRCESNHFAEWVTACKGGRPAFSNFEHGGPLTEMVLLGNLAIRAGMGKKVLWDGPNMQSTNLPELNQFVQREYRKGWSL